MAKRESIMLEAKPRGANKPETEHPDLGCKY